MSGRVAHHKRVIRNILRYDGSGTDERGAAHGMAAHDSTVGSQGGAFLDTSRFQLTHTADVGTRIKNIRKDHARPTEDVVLKGNSFVYGDIVLDLAGVSYNHVLTDDDVLPDVAIIADSSPRENMGKVPDPGTFSNRDIIVDYRSRMDLVVLVRIRSGITRCRNGIPG